MRVALCVNDVSNSRQKNFEEILNLINEAVSKGAKYLFFPETCITGLINSDIPAEDIQLATLVPSDEIKQLSDICKINGVRLSLGIFELCGNKLYDTIIIISTEGEIIFKQRRISSGWFSPKADPEFYGCAEKLDLVQMGFGNNLFVICGDLFDEGIVNQARSLKPDWVIFPFARYFDNCKYDQKRWDEEELPEYLALIKKISKNALMINLISNKRLGGYFGGAWVVKNGIVVKDLKIGVSTVLITDI